MEHLTMLIIYKKKERFTSHGIPFLILSLYFFSVHLRGMIDALMSERNITMFNSNGYYNVL